MLKYCLSLVTFSFLFCVTQQLGGFLAGGRLTLSKEEFNKNYANLFIPAINEKLVSYARKSGENQNPKKFYSFVCGTKQIVSGAILNFEFLACSRSNDGSCSFGQPPSKCTMKLWYQPWLLSGAPVTFKEDPVCNFVTNIKSVGKCTLKQNSNSKFNKNLSTMVMEKEPDSDKETKIKFDKFIEKYNKDYSNDENEYSKRYGIFVENLKIVDALNKLERGTAVYGETKFMDYSSDEFHKYCAPGLKEKKAAIDEMSPSEIDYDAPDSFDWRDHGAVTDVKNQGQCGSCWAFSTTGNIEGQWFISKKKLVSLSEQELVDCDKVDQGCEGGLPSNAYEQIEKLGGLETEQAYPYDASDDTCKFTKSKVRVYINDSITLPSDEAKMAAWLAPNGPISIGINANMMQFYFGGVSHPWKIFCNPSKLDHGVLIVGYGKDNGTPYWIIKNSWGADWGEKGYYRIYRGDGSCGVNKMPTSAIVK